MKTLSIVIPTFNRVGPLKSTLENISHQIQAFDDHEIEVIISDNHSSDSTEIQSREWFAETGIPGGYFKNDKNFGTDRNCDLGVRRSSGKYVWLLSDDDQLEPDAIKKIYDELKNRDVNFAFINYSIITPGFDEYFPLTFNESMEVSVQELILKTKFAFSFLSACVFRREAWLQLDVQKYFDTFWIQIYVAIELAENGKSLIIAQPLIKMIKETLEDSRGNRQDLSKPIHDILINTYISFLRLIESFDACRYEKSFRDQLRELGWGHNKNQILSYKLTRNKYEFDQCFEVFKELRYFFWRKPLFWILHAPLLFLPKIYSKGYFSLVMLKIKIKKFVKKTLINN